MKKICLLLCCALALQMFGACSPKKEEFRTPVNFYYCNKEVSYNSPQAVIQAEVREGYNYHSNVTAFLHAYLLGPNSSELKTMIPSDVYLVSCSVENGVADVTLSSQFSELSGIKLTTACSALLMSIYEFTGVDVLQIRAKEAQLDDKDVFVLTMEDIILMDTIMTQE